jgi:hypothetical protein
MKSLNRAIASGAQHHEERWHRACNAACMESDPNKLLPLLAYAVVSLERRAAEWDIEPGTKTELRAALDSISTLRKRLAWYVDAKWGAA